MLWLVLLCAATCGTPAGSVGDVSWLPLPSLQPELPASQHKTSYTERLVDGWHNRSRLATRRPPLPNPADDNKYPNDVDVVSGFLLNNIADLRQPASGVHKTWPGDTGVESLDDLILYHTYTSGGARPGSRPPRPANDKPVLQHTPGGTVGFIKQPINTHATWQAANHKPHRPSVILVEDVRPPWAYKPHPQTPVTPFTLLTHRPPVEHSTPPSQEPPQIVIINHYPLLDSDPTPTLSHNPPHYPGGIATPTTTYYPPLYLDDFTTTHKPYYPADIATPSPTTTTHKPHYPTEPPFKCPNITITSSINNYNVQNASKEGCGDVNIVINNANQLIKDVSTEAPSVGIQGDPLPPLGDDPADEFPEEEEEPSPSPAGGMAGMMTPVIDAMSNLTPAMSVLAAPMLLFLAFGLGVTGLIFPWALSSVLWRSNQGKAGVSHHHWVHKVRKPASWSWRMRDRDRDGGEFLAQLEEIVRGVVETFELATREWN